MRLYTKEYCQEILSLKNSKYNVIEIIENKDSKKDICVFSCGNPNHELIKILSCNIKKNSVVCSECKKEEHYLNEKEIVESKFINSKYIFDSLNIRSDNKKLWHVEFHNKDGYYFECCYNTLMKLSNIPDDIYIKIGYASPENPYSLENIKIYILINNLPIRYVSGDYINNRSELKCKCLKCCETFSTCWHEISINKGCGLCANNKRKTNEEFLIQIKESVGNEYTFLEEYNGASEPILVRHNLCNHEYSVRPVEFINNGTRCPKCAIEKNSGENHCRWNGGISETYQYLRMAIEPWKFDTSDYYNGKCVISNKTTKKVIHHLNIPFAKIVEECFEELGIEKRKTVGEYSEGEFKELSKLCLEKHYKHGFGVVVHRDLHNEFHKQFGNKDNNRKQFLEFALSKDRDLSNLV